MKREPSLIRPLILGITGVVIIFWLIAVVLSIQVMRHEFDEIFDSALQETAQRLSALIVDDVRHVDGADPEDTERPVPRRSREYLTYQLRDAEGGLVLRSADASAEPFDAPLANGFHDTDRYRIYTARAGDGLSFLQVADRLDERREAVRESALILLVPLLVLAPACVLAVWLIVRRAMRPIDTLRQEIATKDGGNIAPVDAGHLPRELLPIARSINLLLERLGSALDAEREFTANSAHELRTPIAGALAQTQRLIIELEDGPARRRARQIEASLVGLGRLAEKLLQLSRAEAGIGGSDKSADLRKVLDLIVDDFRRDSQSADRLRYQVAPGATLVRNADVDGFGIVMRNLIENALIHGDSAVPVTISLERNGIVRIVNGGSPLSETELQGIKKRFRRGKTNTAGSGVGLAIVESIAVQMGGELELFSPPLEASSGFEARLTIPDRDQNQYA
ncbi:two-component sensor histidine kinase [Rhizobium sullae]|uniref:histidine kinase n=1 Tax=Rhizobium sullae TaxID=50338 RepID=A0A2N0D8J1_RHISU|nr:ATP-binding protein [Rhizobium sullae]PKA42435.1 two-component sensor histidine kinase [Rhizobium sullae]